MILLAELYFDSLVVVGPRRYSNAIITYAGTQYDPRISTAKMTWPGAQRGKYETKKMEVMFDDGDNEIKNHLETERSKGVIAIFRIVETGSIIATLFITDFDFSIPGKVNIIFSDRVGELESQENIMEKYVINSTNLKTAPPNTSIGQCFNFFTGNSTTYKSGAPGKNGLRCWRAESLGSGSRYIVGKAGVNVTMPSAPDFVIDPQGAAQVGFTFSLGIDGYWYASKAGFSDVDYIDVNFTLVSNLTTQQMIQTDIAVEFLNFFQVGTGDLNGLDYLNLHIDPDPLDVQAGEGWKYNHFSFCSATTGTQLLSQVADSIGFDYYIDETNNINFVTIFPGEKDAERFQKWESAGFFAAGGDSQQRKAANTIETAYGINPDGSTERTEAFKNFESRVDNGAWITESLKNPLIPGHDNSVSLPAGEKQILQVAKRIAYLNESPQKNITWEMDIDQAIEAKPFDLWRFSHIMLDIPETLYRITKINHDFTTGKSRLEMKNMSYFDSTDHNQVFRLQGNFPGNESIFFDDISPGGEVYYTNRFSTGSGQEKWVTTDKKFTKGCVIWNGTNNGKPFGSANLNDAWQIWSKDKWSFFAWLKFPVLGTTEILLRIQSPTDTGNLNYFDIRRGLSNQLRLFAVESGSIAFDFQTPINIITSTTQWYHVGLVKSGNNYGWYVDGNQKSYLSSAYTPTGTPFSQMATFAEIIPLNQFYNYVMSEWVIWQDANGPFSVELVPDIGLTSTYTVPDGAVTNVKGKFHDYEGIS